MLPLITMQHYDRTGAGATPCSLQVCNPVFWHKTPHLDIPQPQLLEQSAKREQTARTSNFTYRNCFLWVRASSQCTIYSQFARTRVCPIELKRTVGYGDSSLTHNSTRRLKRWSLVSKESYARTDCHHFLKQLGKPQSNHNRRLKK